MKHRILITTLASVMLASGVGAVTSANASQPVQASSKATVINRVGYHKITITKETAIRKIHYRIPMYKSTLGVKEYADKGLTCKLMRTGTDFGWYLKIPGFKGTWTVVRRYNDYSWFRLGYH